MSREPDLVLATERLAMRPFTCPVHSLVYRVARPAWEQKHRPEAQRS